MRVGVCTLIKLIVNKLGILLTCTSMWLPKQILIKISTYKLQRKVQVP